VVLEAEHGYRCPNLDADDSEPLKKEDEFVIQYCAESGRLSIYEPNYGRPTAEIIGTLKKESTAAKAQLLYHPGLRYTNSIS
jgi:hypothetical protein